MVKIKNNIRKLTKPFYLPLFFENLSYCRNILLIGPNNHEQPKIKNNSKIFIEKLHLFNDYSLKKGLNRN